jgi:hypothetical protein
LSAAEAPVLDWQWFDFTVNAAQFEEADNQ